MHTEDIHIYIFMSATKHEEHLRNGLTVTVYLPTSTGSNRCFFTCLIVTSGYSQKMLEMI